MNLLRKKSCSTCANPNSIMWQFSVVNHYIQSISFLNRWKFNSYFERFCLMFIVIHSSSPCRNILFVIFTTATILTLNDQVHVVLCNSSVFHEALANVAASIFMANVVENQDIFTVFGKWGKFLIFTVPFELLICRK